LVLDIDLNPISINLEEEELVWKSLEICKCGDFLKRTNFDNKCKWIYSSNIGMSGGEKGRVGLARTIYRIMCSKPKYITLDEVDKSIQSEMVVEIMSNIFEYTKKNNILTFIIAHNPDVKKMKLYDQVIKFTNGIISI
jgi:ABC-type multidrug transport system fused ATPase/permease subunit